MPYYSELGIYMSPTNSYTGSYVPGPYSKHSSLLASNFTRPPPTLIKPRNFRGYKPLLATITESQSPLRRINSPKLLPHISPKVTVAKPIKINTADIDVSRNKYRKYERSKPLEDRSERKSPVQNSVSESPRASVEQKEAKPNKIIRRDRRTVRLQTIHADLVPREITNTIRRWRDNFEPEELYGEEKFKKTNKNERKTPGELLKEKFLIRSREDILKPPKRASKKSNKSNIQKTPSFHDICQAITTDKIDEELNPGQPLEIQRRQSRQISTEEIITELKRVSGDLSDDIDALNQRNSEISEALPESRVSVKRKKKLTKKKSNEKVVLSDTENKSQLQRRPTQKKIKRTSTGSSIGSDITDVDPETEKAYQEAIRDISQVEIEKIKIKPKPIITATVDIEEIPSLKAIVDEIEVVESPKAKVGNKFKFNVIVEEIEEAKRRSVKKMTKTKIDDNGTVHVPKSKDLLISNIMKNNHSAHLGHILEDIKEISKEEAGKVDNEVSYQNTKNNLKKVTEHPLSKKIATVEPEKHNQKIMENKGLNKSSSASKIIEDQIVMNEKGVAKLAKKVNDDLKKSSSADANLFFKSEQDDITSVNEIEQPISKLQETGGKPQNPMTLVPEKDIKQAGSESVPGSPVPKDNKQETTQPDPVLSVDVKQTELKQTTKSVPSSPVTKDVKQISHQISVSAAEIKKTAESVPSSPVTKVVPVSVAEKDIKQITKPVSVSGPAVEKTESAPTLPDAKDVKQTTVEKDLMQVGKPAPSTPVAKDEKQAVSPAEKDIKETAKPVSLSVPAVEKTESVPSSPDAKDVKEDVEEDLRQASKSVPSSPLAKAAPVSAIQKDVKQTTKPVPLSVSAVEKDGKQTTKSVPSSPVAAKDAKQVAPVSAIQKDLKQTAKPVPLSVSAVEKDVKQITKPVVSLPDLKDVKQTTVGKDLMQASGSIPSSPVAKAAPVLAVQKDLKQTPKPVPLSVSAVEKDVKQITKSVPSSPVRKDAKQIKRSVEAKDEILKSGEAEKDDEEQNFWAVIGPRESVYIRPKKITRPASSLLQFQPEVTESEDTKIEENKLQLQKENKGGVKEGEIKVIAHPQLKKEAQKDKTVVENKDTKIEKVESKLRLSQNAKKIELQNEDILKVAKKDILEKEAQKEEIKAENKVTKVETVELGLTQTAKKAESLYKDDQKKETKIENKDAKVEKVESKPRLSKNTKTVEPKPTLSQNAKKEETLLQIRKLEPLKREEAKISTLPQSKKVEVKNNEIKLQKEESQKEEIQKSTEPESQKEEIKPDAVEIEEESAPKKAMPSKRSLVNKATIDDPDLVVFIPPKPEPEPEPKPAEPTSPEFVPLQSNRFSLSQFTKPFKKPEQSDKCPVEIYATPKWIRHRHIPRPRHPVPVQESSSEEDDDDDEEEESEESSEEETSSDEASDSNTVYKVGASTSSNDSGFDSGVPGSRNKDCDVNCHKKCEKLTANLCGVNQKLIVEAIESVRKGSVENRDSPTTKPAQNPALALDSGEMLEEYSQSSTYAGFQRSGRITPPATTIPRFRKYCVDDFNFLKVLGKGSFGKVLLAELKNTEYYYAIKCLKKDVVLEDDDVECTLIERKVLALATKHPYLCHLLCTFQTESHLFFVMEYLNGGDLMFHIQHEGRFSEERARFYGAEIVSGLKFLHNKGIVYRDLKLDNILLDFDGHVRIADFGMCKLQIFLDRMADTFCGTPDYMAPEIIKGQHYNQCVDWWSFGVLLYEMLIGQSPFSGCDEDELFWSICNEKPVIPRFLTAEASAVLLLFLEKDANKRLGHRFCPSGDIQDQPFFKPIIWDRLESRTLESPFKPKLQHPLDTQYFDKTFTVEKAKLTPIEHTILQSMDQTQFQGFSYTNPNATDK